MIPDISGLDHGLYKPGVEYIKVGNKFLLDQNLDSNSFYAKAAKSGHKIQWELNKPPVAGEKLDYTGKIIVDGKEMYKYQATELLSK
jgi:esterase/lipase superfamily enzyme